MLALDFDGVVCDALGECAAVTWFAAHLAPGEKIPALPGALTQVAEEFLATFASVRPYSRTLSDFMVAHAVVAGTSVDGAAFERLRAAAGHHRLAEQAARGELIRACWRRTQPTEWLCQHTIYAPVGALIAQVNTPVAVVSAKDGDSIWAILANHGLADHVETVVGSCPDKPAALAILAGDAGNRPIDFLDDNLANARAAADVPGVSARWATWGYHSAEDVTLAALMNFPSLALDELHILASHYPISGSSRQAAALTSGKG